MKKALLFHSILFLSVFFASNQSFAIGKLGGSDNPYHRAYVLNDTLPSTSTKHLGENAKNPFDLKNPIQEVIEYNPSNNSFSVSPRIGDDFLSTPTTLDYNEYLDKKTKQQERQYFAKLGGISSGADDGDLKSVSDPIRKIDLGSNDPLDRLFGPGGIKITPQGNLDVKLGLSFQKIDNPTLLPQQQKQGPLLDFDMGINVNMQGSIGSKLKLNTRFNTNATFNFDNQMNIDYDGASFGEDEIIRDISAGDVSLPLRSNLIQGAQSLFGIRADLQFGKLKLTAVASQQRSERKEIVIEGGSQINQFEINADSYDENRHFFLTHFNRDAFEDGLKTLPQINSLFKINPQSVEIWITDELNTTQDGVRTVVALSDLGEPSRFNSAQPTRWQNSSRLIRDPFSGSFLPDNETNNIYPAIKDTTSLVRIARNVDSELKGARYGFENGRDFEQFVGRKLKSTEYSINPDLGFVSLNLNVQPDQVVGIAFQYSYNGNIYQVGEFSGDVPDENSKGEKTVLFVKMLKSTTTRVDIAMWDLMMKNFYSIGAYQVGREDFKLDAFYEDPGNGLKRFLPIANSESTPLIRLLGLDRLNSRGDRLPDGAFDFVEGVTINPSNGRIMFPSLEPFGESLRRRLTNERTIGLSDTEADQYVYDQLYDSTLFVAQQFPELNRYTIKGSYKNSVVSSEISLGTFNLKEPEDGGRGPISVYAGGSLLRENTDYIVNYQTGRIKILNDAYLSTGVPIRIQFEDQSLFGLTSQSMLGVRADYEVSDKLLLGGTFLNLVERPFTNKVNIGDDPINNKIYGLDVNYEDEAPFLTKMVDALPGISTKAPSRISFQAEGAYLKPGFSKAIDVNKNGGTAFIDDFEGSTTEYNLLGSYQNWKLASIPQNDKENNNPLFKESQFSDSIFIGANRARLNWLRTQPNLEDCNDIYCSEVLETEVFVNAPPNANGQDNRIFPLNLYFDPEERGPYNYDIPGGYGDYTAGIDNNGFLLNPKERWGGIMRETPINDFEQANVEFIEFWMLDPYIESSTNPINSSSNKDAFLYFNLGNISEDIIKDGSQAFESALPNPNNPDRPIQQSNLGVSSIDRPVNDGFDNEFIAEADLGYDGLDNEGEAILFQEYLDAMSALPAAAARERALRDPSNDDYLHFNDNSYPQGIGYRERYRYFNAPQGNNQPSGDNQAYDQQPDSEDLNRDRSLNTSESYFQYKIPLGPDFAESEFVVDKVESAENERVWYRFKIPITQYDEAVGGINDFRSIRFARLYLNGFDVPVHLRFASFNLVRSQWRRYNRELREPSVAPITDNTNSTLFDISQVNYEENSNKIPFNYTVPPGVERERIIGGGTAERFQNEQSLAVTVCNLVDGDARAVFRPLTYDLRLYDSLSMLTHLEAIDDLDLEGGDLKIFIRIGSDYQENYYEYEMSLTPSDLEAYNLLTGNGDTPEKKAIVWLAANRLALSLKQMTAIKRSRDEAGISPTDLFKQDDENREDATYYVKGNPNLGFTRGIMIGFRNPANDGKPHCGEIWLNELAASGLDSRGGGAAVAKLDLQLADFGAVSMSGSYSSVGWGRLDQSLNERSREEVFQYDVSTNLALDRFLPEGTGIKIPFYAQYSNSTKTPQYDPYDLDVELKDKIAAAESKAEKDSLREQAIEQTTIQSVAFTNVRKERTDPDRKPMPWDIENVSVSYSYSKSNTSTPIIEFDERKQHRAQFNYAYSAQPFYIKPFNKLIKKDKYLKLIKEMNFNPIPSSFTFNSTVDRQQIRTRYRFTGGDELTSTFFDNRFNWNRNYGLNWNLTDALDFSFNASVQAVVDEIPVNGYDFDEDRVFAFDELGNRNSFLNESINNLGRIKDYNHTMSLVYDLPFNRLPFLDWVKGTAQVNTSYTWNAGAYSAESVFKDENQNRVAGYDSLGNVVQNTQNRQLNLDFNFVKIYKNNKFLSQVYNYNKNKSKKKKGDDKESDSKRKSTARNRPGANKEEKDKDDKKSNGPSPIVAQVLRPLLMLKSAKFSYSQNFGTVIQGFKPQSKYLGLDESFSAPGRDFILGLQPGEDFFNKAASNDWIVSSIFLNKNSIQNESEKFNIRLTLEPLRDFRIDLNAEKSKTLTSTFLFKNLSNSNVFYTDPNNDFPQRLSNVYSEEQTFIDQNGNPVDSVVTVIEPINHQSDYNQIGVIESSRKEVGSFSMTYFAANTLFKNDKDARSLFSETFKGYRNIVSQRWGEIEGNTTPHELDEDFVENFGKYQNEVLIPSFLAAYGGRDPQKVELTIGDLIKSIPRPNWNLTYTGLSKIPAMKKIFSSVRLSHRYSSTLTINQFTSDLNFVDYESGQRNVNDLTQNYYSEYEIPAIQIQESFAPLIGLDVRTKKGFDLGLKMSRKRNLDMNFNDFQLAETRSSDYSVRMGYVWKDIYITFLKEMFKPKTGKKKKKPTRSKRNKGKEGEKKPKNPNASDLKFNFDFTYADGITLTHQIDENGGVEPTRGTTTYKFAPSLDYDVTRQLNLRFYFDYDVSKPKTSNSNPITRWSGGFNIRFSLR